MRNAVLLVLVLALALGAEWIYRVMLRPVDPPTPRMLQLAAHFNEHGLQGRLYPVRHTNRHARMSAAAAFQIDGYPLPVSIAECPDEAAAEASLRAIRANPSLAQAARKGVLVMHLPMWKDDTGPLARKVQDLFSTFRPDAGKSD